MSAGESSRGQPGIIAGDVIAFRHADARYTFLWQTARQPEGRWNRDGAGPVQYLADTPDGAWAEFLRHEEIIDAEDLMGVCRALWAVDIGPEPRGRPEIALELLTGGRDTYASCQREADRLKRLGHDGLVAPSAALLPGQAHGWQCLAWLHPAVPRDGSVFVLFGERERMVGWLAALGRPGDTLLRQVRHFPGPASD
ncbi:MAG: RES family NAD+ phosphorylase [Chloroflexota bacterium]